MDSSDCEHEIYFSLECLPPEILHTVLGRYCDASSLEQLRYACSWNLRYREYIWNLLAVVVDHRIASAQAQTSWDHEHKDDLRQLATNILRNLNSVSIWDRHQLFRNQLSVMKYSEGLQGIVWCGYVEFGEPVMTDSNVLTANVIVKSDADGWSWNNAYGWKRSFSRTIKVISQHYNFIPVKPRGRIYGVSKEDQEIIQIVSSRLQARDQVMTLRYKNSNGFILRIISPEQAHQRLSGMGTSLVAAFQTSPNSLVCSWECPESPLATLANSAKIEIIESVVEAYDTHLS